MPKKLDQILVVDVEATCWKGPRPPDQESEIIEIGLCPVDVATLTRVERRSLLVKPERSSVSPFCTEITTLTQADVEQELTLAEACEILREEYLAGRRLWASYGNYDRQQFEREQSPGMNSRAAMRKSLLKQAPWCALWIATDAFNDRLASLSASAEADARGRDFRPDLTAARHLLRPLPAAFRRRRCGS